MTNPFNRGSSPDARLPRPAARRNGEVVQFRGVLRPHALAQFQQLAICTVSWHTLLK